MNTFGPLEIWYPKYGTFTVFNPRITSPRKIGYFIRDGSYQLEIINRFVYKIRIQ